MERRDFDSIYQTHYAFVWRSVQTLGVHPAAAEDAAQDTFVVVHRRMADLKPGASVKAWLFGIAVRVAKDYRRTLRRRGTSPLEDADREVSTVTGPFERTAEAQAVQVVERFLTQLDDDKRVVFVMSELEGMTVPEIAEALEANLNTVYSRLRAARERFVCFVRERVAALIAGGVSAAVASKTLAQRIVGYALAGVTKQGLFSSMAAKLTVASAVVVTAGTLTVVAVRPVMNAERPREAVQSHHSEEAVRFARADTSQKAAPEVRVEVREARAPAAKRATRPRRKHDARPYEETLQAEMRVLKRASGALTLAEASTADLILASYRSSFPQPMLLEEHDGLRAIADCLLQREGATQRAKHFLDRASTSVLAPRIARVCGVQR